MRDKRELEQVIWGNKFEIFRDPKTGICFAFETEKKEKLIGESLSERFFDCFR